jgi:hypothetical protein
MILGLEDSCNEIFVFNDNLLLCTYYSVTLGIYCVV